jgi:hypothetical protein
VNPQASLPANSTAQQPLPHPVDENNQAVFVAFDFRHSMGF